MNRFRLMVFGAEIASVTIAFFFSVTPTQAKQCSAERPSNAQSYWSYRLIDGRKCWYEGKPMLSKSLLHWPVSSRAVAATPPRPSSERQPAKLRNPLDAQASISDDDAAKPRLQSNPEVVDASPMPRAKLTSDDLRAWGQGKVAAITAEPIVTILDRWPDQELPQHQVKPTPVGEPLLMNPRAMMVAIIIFMAVMAVLVEMTFHRRPLHRW